MLDRLTHRGPDGQGTHEFEHAWLGHRRLAIVDLAGGAQPLRDPGGEYWLVGDGEVYNYQRLRRELESQGHEFRSRADMESALHLLEAHGLSALSRLWGNFALAGATVDGQFFAARDTMGIAPLYWARQDHLVIFGSELKAFDPDRRPAVEPFPPGHFWTPADGLRAFRSLPKVEPVSPAANSDPDAEPSEDVLATIRNRLISSVERLMVTDVPVGALLSGGLDSSIVTAIAARHAHRNGRQLRTFAVGGADSDDILAARQVAGELGTDHSERLYTDDELIDWVPEVIRVIESFDPQLVHSSVPNLLVSKLAARSVKVVLIGEGADELFAGYSYYSKIHSEEELHDELLATIRGMHIGGLQRVDRIAGATGLEARTPFLDLDVVELGLSLPAQWKLSRGDRMEKWLLRKAFTGWLPERVLWRPKAQFGQGSGARDVLGEYYSSTVSEEEFQATRHVLDPPLRSREELAYYRLFQRELTGIDPRHLVGRFAEW
ncbi:asparagine synthase (glutamine-hydrolyzing) [Pseudonocardia asaccharolytica]|uniref:asparagine synthase (glutamine-hydrolyzing) n=1 Tax=Pseudonocardia asaccharolytica DSM 44247 = NBRC 16224 TaxID=1123024 RepID=A0A511D4R6_9PSEU|nr:asparagine synthase (glutamine-hydrolyzing) [Pseudonocardia asaccharolytica]GEL19761.1 asparagine synthase B [Pseudonocardia asaccharolytica DSM 44247 = NBRC 16224]